MNKRKLIFTALVVIAIVAWLCLFMMVPDRGKNSTITSEDKLGTEDSFGSRHTSSELAEGIQKLSEKRGGLPAELALKGVMTSEQREFWLRKLQYQNQRPDQAIHEAKGKLEELEARLVSATSKEDRESLERHKQLVEQILLELKQMQE